MFRFQDYQDFAETTDIVGDHTDRIGHVQYLALGLVGEAGEVADKVKKLVRDRGGKITTADETEISRELGDVLWYVARLADVLRYPLTAVAGNNVYKLRDRQRRGRLRGSGDIR